MIHFKVQSVDHLWLKSAVYGQWNWVCPNDVVLDWLVLVIKQMSQLDDTHNMSSRQNVPVLSGQW